MKNFGKRYQQYIKIEVSGLQINQFAFFINTVFDNKHYKAPGNCGAGAKSKFIA